MDLKDGINEILKSGFKVQETSAIVGFKKVQKTSAIVEEKIDTAADATALSRFRLGGCTPSLPKSKFPIIFRKDGP